MSYKPCSQPKRVNAGNCPCHSLDGCMNLSRFNGHEHPPCARPIKQKLTLARNIPTVSAAYVGKAKKRNPRENRDITEEVIDAVTPLITELAYITFPYDEQAEHRHIDAQAQRAYELTEAKYL